MLVKTSPLAAALLLAIPLWLVACRDGGEARHDPAPANITANITVADDPASPDSVAPAATPATDPASESARGEAGARAILTDWAGALHRRDWPAARAAWGHGGADSGLDAAAFARAYDRYQRIEVELGDGAMEGAAGSLYYEAPVTFVGTLRDGRQVRMTGPVTLRRVNDVDGASAADLTWHIAMSDLRLHP